MYKFTVLIGSYCCTKLGASIGLWRDKMGGMLSMLHKGIVSQ